MTEKEKKNILGELYGLRAGLSVASEEYDKIQAEETRSAGEFEELTDKIKEAEYKFADTYILFNDDDASSMIDFTEISDEEKIEFLCSNALGITIDEIAEQSSAMVKIRKKRFKGKQVDQQTAKTIYGQTS